MNDFKITILESQALVADSREIARELGIDHHNFMQTIYKYQDSIETNFGHLLFKTDTVTNSAKATNQIKFALLTEDQFIFVATLSRNTEKVVQVKARLVKAFSLAKQALQDKANPSKNPSTPNLNPVFNLSEVVNQFTANAIESLSSSHSVNDLTRVSQNLNQFIANFQLIEQKQNELVELITGTTKQGLQKTANQAVLKEIVKSFIDDHKLLSKKPRSRYSTKTSTLRIAHTDLIIALSEHETTDISYQEILHTMCAMGFEVERLSGITHWVLVY